MVVYNLLGQIGKLLSLDVSTNTPIINKGKMYANTQLEQKKYETNYDTTWQIDIANKDIINGIKVEDRLEYFVDPSENKYSTSNMVENYSHYVKTMVSKNNFTHILGEEGYIKIYDNQGQEIAQINNQTPYTEDEFYIVSYPNDVFQIAVETSNPIGEGTLYINNTRTIEPELAYTKEQMRNFIKLETVTNLMQITDNGNFQIEEKTLSIPLEETNTNANIVIDKTNLSTIVTNEDVEIKIELDNNRQNTDLYENPIFMIELPEYIEDIKVKEANVLYDENLTIQAIDGIVQNGKTYLQIKLEGTQDGFSPGSFTNGTNIVLKTDIKPKLLTPNMEDHINLYYLNQNAVSYTNNVLIGDQIAGAADSSIHYSTPPEMIAVATISNYDNKGNTVSSIKQGVQTDKIAIYDSAKLAKMQLKIVNNTGNNCNNVIAIGRIPFAGNKDISSNEDLGTNLDTYLRSAISVNGVDQNKVSVYYSENGEATKDLTNPQNSWTQTPTDITKVKSYLIALNDYEMATGTTLDAYYDFEIPANLEHGINLYETFEVNFMNNAYTGAAPESVRADTVGLTTGEGPKVEVVQTIESNDGIVKSGDVVKVIALINNTGSVDLENVVLREYIPAHTRYTVYREGWGDVSQVKSEYIYPRYLH